MDEEALAKEGLRVSLAAWLKEAAGAPLLSRLLGPGQPLDLILQQRMEALFGRDLSEVRIHDTRQAGEIASRLGAEAFTLGPGIFAAPERLAAATPQGLALLAHELTHFIQQTQPSTVAVVSPLSSGQPTLPTAPGSFSPGEELSHPPKSIQAPLQTQLAAEVPAAAPEASEAQALAVEQAIREMPAGELGRPTAVDPREVADRVYRLMQDDLRLERERRAF